MVLLGVSAGEYVLELTVLVIDSGLATGYSGVDEVGDDVGVKELLGSIEGVEATSAETVLLLSGILRPRRLKTGPGE